MTRAKIGRLNLLAHYLFAGPLPVTRVTGARAFAVLVVRSWRARDSRRAGPPNSYLGRPRAGPSVWSGLLRRRRENKGPSTVSAALVSPLRPGTRDVVIASGPATGPAFPLLQRAARQQCWREMVPTPARGDVGEWQGSGPRIRLERFGDVDRQLRRVRESHHASSGGSGSV